MNAPLEPTIAADAEKSTAQPARASLKVDDSHIVASYANFCRITGTPGARDATHAHVNVVRSAIDKASIVC